MRHFVLLLQLTALGTSRIIVTRQDEGDYFSGIVTVQCHEISAYEDSDGCHCDQGLTFSTEYMECQSYKGRAHYSFYRQNLRSTYVSTVYAVCGIDNFCTLNSTATFTELPIAVSQWNYIDSDSNCVVNFVEIIHDCVPRLVDLDLTFASHGTDNLYLELNKTIPLNYLDGELFQADITCTAGGTGNGKLMFKFNGTRILSQRVANRFLAAGGFYATGSFAHIPAYMPSETSCVASTISVPQTTIMATNNHIPVKTPLPTTMQNDNGTHRHSGGHDSDDDDDNNIVMGTGVGSGFILLVLLVVVIAITVICFFRCRNGQGDYQVHYDSPVAYKGGDDGVEFS